MKKFLLSSIIMLGVCGAVSAQNATGSKTKKNDGSATGTSAAAPMPQKAAVMPPTDDVAAPAPMTAADKQAASVAPVTRITKPTRTSAVTTVNAAGIVVSDEEKIKSEKAAAAKAASEKKNQQ